MESARDQDSAKAEEVEAWLDLVARTYNVLPMDPAAFRTWANLMHCRSDAWYEDARIAAIAKTNGSTVGTRNVSDFADLGISPLNPFEGVAP